MINIPLFLGGRVHGHPIQYRIQIVQSLSSVIRIVILYLLQMIFLPLHGYTDYTAVSKFTCRVFDAEQIIFLGSTQWI